MQTITLQQASAINDRSRKIARELSEEGLLGWFTAMAVLGWLLSNQSKELADDLTRDLTNEIRAFPGYPK